MLTAHDLHRLPQMVATKTRNLAIAEDAVQDAIVALLERGEDLTPAKVHAYAKFKALEGVRHEESEHRFLGQYMDQHATDVGDPLFVGLDRMRPPRNGGVAPLDLAECKVCGADFKPYTRNKGKRNRTCGAPKCVTTLANRTRRERALASVA